MHQHIHIHIRLELRLYLHWFTRVLLSASRHSLLHIHSTSYLYPLNSHPYPLLDAFVFSAISISIKCHIHVLPQYNCPHPPFHLSTSTVRSMCIYTALPCACLSLQVFEPVSESHLLLLLDSTVRASEASKAGGAPQTLDLRVKQFTRVSCANMQAAVVGVVPTPPAPKYLVH